MPRLATFLHISDLHIGEFDPLTGDSRISPMAAHVLSKFPIYDGLLGHHAAGLRHLARFTQDLRERENDCALIVTGDLSRWGDHAELTAAQAFITSSVDMQPPHREQIGLYFGENALIIPGNHDHWAGVAPPVGATPSCYRHVFHRHRTPSERVIALPNGRKIRFIHVDSDADVNANSWSRLLARGHFVSQLDALDASLPAKRQDEVRVLVIHHSRSHTGTVLEITPASRQALDRFLRQQQISVMLTGHTHIPVTRLHPLAHTAGVHELGAGSTTQFDVPPYRWSPSGRARSELTWHPNTLMVHRLYSKKTALKWETETFRREPNGFISTSHYMFQLQ